MKQRLALSHEQLDYASMRVGLKKIEDAVVNLSSFSKTSRKYSDKTTIIQAIENKRVDTLREISNFFYNSSGIYQRLCKYLAYLYKYDWYITPMLLSNKKVKNNKVLNDFYTALGYLDSSNLKRMFGTIALEVVKNGSFYMLVTDTGSNFAMQQLPNEYCRSRYFHDGLPVVELKLDFFTKYFPSAEHRARVLKMFPKDVQAAYVKYLDGKLKPDYPGDVVGWITLDTNVGFKFALNNNDIPTLVNVIPSLIDLDEAQALDKKKMMQQLLKILVQKLPLDKNNDLIFDIDEAKDIHNNAVMMLKRAVGIDVLTTFADVSVEDMADQNTATTKDDLQKVERTVYNNLGVSQNLFNTDGSVALEKSVANDEASMRDLMLQFVAAFNVILRKRFNSKSYSFKFDILDTTIYNYKEIAKMFKEQMQYGYSKILPQIALGQSQATMLSQMVFENDILQLAELMTPPQSSNTMSGKSATQNTEEKEPGRPSLDPDQKSDKTLANEEAIG